MDQIMRISPETLFPGTILIFNNSGPKRYRAEACILIAKNTRKQPAIRGASRLRTQLRCVCNRRHLWPLDVVASHPHFFSASFLSQTIMRWSLPHISYPPAKAGFWSPVTSTLNWCEEVRHTRSVFLLIRDRPAITSRMNRQLPGGNSVASKHHSDLSF